MGQATIFATFENQSFGPCTIEQAIAMESYKHKTGVTLVEILVVVAIIAILATMVISLAARIDSQGKERLTENTFALLNAAWVQQMSQLSVTTMTRIIREAKRYISS